MANTKAKDAMGNAAGAGADEAAPWETPEVTPAADQEMEKFVAPNPMTWRRKLSEHELMAWIAMQAKMGDGDDEAKGMSMLADVVAAESLDDLLSQKVDTVKSREILDTILECNGIKIIMSDIEEGCPYFAVCDVRVSNTGTRETISLGGWRAVGHLGRMLYQAADFTEGSEFLVPEGTPGAWPKETFPFYFRIKQKETAKGHMNYLAPAMGA